VHGSHDPEILNDEERQLLAWQGDDFPKQQEHDPSHYRQRAEEAQVLEYIGGRDLGEIWILYKRGGGDL
jgi:hypothetical protein